MNQPGDKLWVCEYCSKVGESEVDIKRKHYKLPLDNSDRILFLHEDCWNKMKDARETLKIKE
jgi:hypothetical protein